MPRPPTDGPPNRTPIADYALVGDGRACALISRAGSVDWLAWPRIDAPAAMAALLGTVENGRWLLAPTAAARTSRGYEDGTLILRTEHRTDGGVVRVTDAVLGPEDADADVSVLLRRVQGLAGRVRMRFELTLRPDYGRTIPWVETVAPGRWEALAGPERIVLAVPPALAAQLTGHHQRTDGRFTLAAGETADLMLIRSPAHRPPPRDGEPWTILDAARSRWREATRKPAAPGADDPFAALPPRWRAAVERARTVIAGLTYAPTGGIAAAATTSLPETPGGTRNWDYRYCWLRDSAFTLQALARLGMTGAAEAWRDWLLRAVAGAPDQVQIMYGLAGERTLTEWEADWLPGHGGARPVRVGNEAAGQFQLDVYGKVAEALACARAAGLRPHPREGALRNALLRFLADAWRRPDEGIWKVRGPRRQFVHRKSWPGWPSTAPRGWAAEHRHPRQGPPDAGGASPTRSTPRSANAASIRISAASRSPTGRARSTRACF